MKGAANTTRPGPRRGREHAVVMGAALAMALVLSMTAPVVAQQAKIRQEGRGWVQEITGSMPASSTLIMKIGNGNVVVQGGAQSQITYALKQRSSTSEEAAARQQFHRAHFMARKSGDVAYIAAMRQGGPIAETSGDLTLQVPRSIRLIKLVSRGGNDSITGISGQLEVSTGGGNLRLDDIGGDITAATAGGSVEVGNAGANLTLKTGGGDVHITAVKGQIVIFSGGGNIKVGSGSQGVIAQTAGGGIDVKHCGGELKAQTGGGSLTLGKIAGPATMQTGGGSIRLTSASGPVIANTTGGTIELYGLSHGAQVQSGGGQIVAEFLASSAFTESSLQTPAGDIIIYLAPGLKASIRAAVDYGNGHRIRSDFRELKVSAEGGQYGPKVIYAEGDLNGGGALLRVRTSNGDIEFRRAKK